MQDVCQTGLVEGHPLVSSQHISRSLIWKMSTGMMLLVGIGVFFLHVLTILGRRHHLTFLRLGFEPAALISVWPLIYFLWPPGMLGNLNIWVSRSSSSVALIKQHRQHIVTMTHVVVILKSVSFAVCRGYRLYSFTFLGRSCLTVMIISLWV